MSDSFNPHENRTDAGVLVTQGMKVLDYNYREGVVVKDRDAERCGKYGPCNGDHWFDVEPLPGQEGGGMFNATRLKAIS